MLMPYFSDFCFARVYICVKTAVYSDITYKIYVLCMITPNSMCNDSLTISYDIGISEKSDEGCECEFCGKVFRGLCRSAHLKRHIKTIHVKSTIYVCPVCDKTFNQYSNLKRHFPRHVAS